MAILGLLDTEKFASQRFTNVRRSVFYFYPNGAAPLVGLVSLLDDEDTNDPKFSWWEKRLSKQRSLTAVNTTGAFITNTGSNADAASPFTSAPQTTIRVIVADATLFRVGHQVRIYNVPVNGGTFTNLYGRVEASSTATGSGGTKNGIDVRLTEAATNILNVASSLGLEVWVVGNVHAQGQTGAIAAPYNLPVNIENFCQIFRTPFNFTGTALKTAAKFDESGPYKDKSKEASIYHMTEIEKAFIFGRKAQTTQPVTLLPEYYTGGILWTLEQWELTSSNPYGEAGSTASDADDNKRIINNTGGTVNEKTYDTYLERAFRVTNNKTNEKLCLCGSGALKVLNQMYRNKSVLNVQQGSKDMTYGMSVVSHLTSFGTVHYRTHPLFSDNPVMRYNMLFLDVHNLKYRYVQGRDTEILTMRQPNNADYREDEWLTEAGLEARFPESHLYLQNVLDYIS
jgi:hypothetical protein